MDRPRNDLESRRRKRWLLWGFGGAAVVTCGIALAMLEPLAPHVDARGLFVDTVQRGELVRRVRGPGILVPRDQRWIAAAANGRVERIVVRPGTVV